MNYLFKQGGVLLLVAASLGGCHTKEKEPPLEAFPVHVKTVSHQSIEDTLVVMGSLKAKDEATLFSRVPGKLKENLLKEGDRVAKDQTVALVERDEVGVVFKPAPVPSTLQGVVGRTYLDRGQNVTPATPIALVVDDTEVIAQANIPERYAGRVQLGQTVQGHVEAAPNQIFTGEVTRVSPVVEAVTRSTPIEVRMENGSGKLKSGMFAELRIAIAKKSHALAVPSESLVEGSPFAVFLVKDGKAVKREVVLGIRNDRVSEIVSGLAAGDQVITSGLFALKDGSPVDVVTEDAPAGEQK
jgi:membrane fusion protein (multidrug efflux system)